MNINNRKLIILLVLGLVFLLPVIPLLSACEPETKVTFVNKQNQEISIFVAHVRNDGSNDGLTPYGTVSALTSKTIYITFLGGDWVNRIEIRNTEGKILFSKDYKMDDLDKINWTIRSNCKLFRIKR
jgi:hypothetical protein